MAEEQKRDWAPTIANLEARLAAAPKDKRFGVLAHLYEAVKASDPSDGRLADWKKELDGVRAANKQKQFEAACADYERKIAAETSAVTRRKIASSFHGYLTKHAPKDARIAQLASEVSK